MIEPRNETVCGADVVFRAEGHIVRRTLASCERSTGVEERSMLARVPQEPGRSRSLPSRQRCGHRLKKRSRPAQRHRAVLERIAIDDGYAEVKATKPKRMGYEKSETADSTDEGGEPTRRDPLEGSGSRRKQACGGKDGEDIEPRGHLNATTQDSDYG